MSAALLRIYILFGVLSTGLCGCVTKMTNIRSDNVAIRACSTITDKKERNVLGYRIEIPVFEAFENEVE